MGKAGFGESCSFFYIIMYDLKERTVTDVQTCSMRNLAKRECKRVY